MTFDPDVFLYENQTVSWQLADQTLAPVECENVIFRGVSFQGATTRRWIFEDCRFIECNLALWRPIGCRFSDVTFEGCKATGVDWTMAKGRFDVTFTQTDLELAVFKGMDLRGVGFNGGRLRDVDFSQSNATDVLFNEVMLEGALFERANLSGADLSSAQGYVIDPRVTTVRGAQFSMEAALDIARLFGIKVS